MASRGRRDAGSRAPSHATRLRGGRGSGRPSVAPPGPAGMRVPGTPGRTGACAVPAALTRGHAHVQRAAAFANAGAAHAGAAVRACRVGGRSSRCSRERLLPRAILLATKEKLILNTDFPMDFERFAVSNVTPAVPRRLCVPPAPPPGPGGRCSSDIRVCFSFQFY